MATIDKRPIEEIEESGILLGDEDEQNEREVETND